MRGRKNRACPQLSLNRRTVPAYPIPHKAQGLPVRCLRQRMGQEYIQFFSLVRQLSHGRHSRRKRGPVYLPCTRIRVIDRDGVVSRPGVSSLTEPGRKAIHRWLAQRGKAV